MHVICTVAYHHVCLVGAPADNLFTRDVCRKGRSPALARTRGAGREADSRLFEQAHKAVETDIARGEEHGVVGAVELASEAQRVVRRVLPEALRLAQDVVSEGMAVEYHVLELVVNKLRRRVVVALYLVAHHLDFLVQLGLRIGAVQHYV